MTLQEITAQELEHILTNVPILYKYLDFDGAIKMLRKHNIKFANLSTVNDPYDCYHGLIDWKGMPDNIKAADHDEYLFEQKNKQLLNHLGVASFSDCYKNLFLWGYYNYHQGICLGLDRDKLLDYISENQKRIFLVKVKYEEEIQKINFWEATKKDSGINIFTQHLIRIKSTVWEKENEIRLVYEGIDLNPEKRITFPQFMPIPPECFVELHLGSNLQDNDTLTVAERVIILLTLAWRINPEMKIYQMLLNPDRFDIDREEITKEKVYQNAKDGFDKLLNELKGK